MDSRRCRKALESTAKCPLCSETLEEPKTLPCLHSFCLLCLDNLAQIARRRPQEAISCPICQTTIPIPEDNTFSDLPTSFHLERFKEILAVSNGNQEAITCTSCNEGYTAISYCFACKDYLCSRCDKAHRRLRVTRDHSNILLQNLQRQGVEDVLQRPVMCSQKYHEKKEINRYCRQCDECICHICRDESHRRHDVVDIQQAARKGKKQLDEAVKKAEEEILACEDEIKENAHVLENRMEEIGTARRNMKAIVRELVTSLKEHEKAVLTKMDDIKKQQEQLHATKQRNLELFVTRLRSPVEHGKSVLERKVDVEIVKEHGTIIDRCEDLLNSKETKGVELPFVNYITDEEMCQRVRLSGSGHVIVSTTDPSQSVVQGEGLRDPVVGRKTKILVRTRDSGSKQCYQVDDQVKIKIQTPSGEELKAAFKDQKDGTYTATFIPKFVGEHEVMVNINGQPLTDSPWSFQVTPHQYQMMSVKLGNKQTKRKLRDDEEISSLHSLLYDPEVSFPQDVAISPVTGNIAVLGLSGIKVFDRDGKYITGFGRRCEGKRLKEPHSVAFSISGDIIVIDRTTITQCTAEGHFVRHFMKHTNNPDSVSVARDGRVIVCDIDDALIKVLSPNGSELLQSFGDPYLYGSPSFAVHHRDKFFVSYREKHRVMVFNDEGTFLFDIGAAGHGQEKLTSPLGLAIDKFNHLIVCDSDSSRLQVFTLDGRYVTTISGFGSPEFAAVSKEGQLYVTDQGKDCVHVLQ